MRIKEFKLSKGTNQSRSDNILEVFKFLNDLPESEDQSVKIGNWDSSKSAKQRQLNWKWNHEVAESGIGNRDNAEDVHLDAKYKFALPILLSDEDNYSVWIQDKFLKLVKDNLSDGDLVKSFITYDIHTEQMQIDQVARMLKEFQFYWTKKGVSLTDPSIRGLDLIKDSMR